MWLLPDRLFPPRILGMKDFGMKREIRDPIYGYVYINGFENKIIDSKAFQRLDRILQMPTAHFVYPSGCYTRKSHSIGTMHLAHKAFLHLLYRQTHDIRSKISPLLLEPVVAEQNLDPGLDRLDQDLGNSWWDGKTFAELLQCLRLSALLHDIGHAPFCHLFEDVCTELSKTDSSIHFNHEEMGLKIIEEKLASKFKSPFSHGDATAILSKRTGVPSFLHELLDGPYDCDKLDYLQRDSYHTGTREYGSIDSQRVIDGFRVKESKLLVSKSAIGALINSFNAVQYMYTNVYYHKTSRIFDFMISDALLLIPDFIKKMTSDVNEFLRYDSSNFVRSIKGKRASGTGDDFSKAYKILKNVLDRKKSYAHIISYPVTLRIVTDRNTELKALADELEETSEDLDIRVDYLPKIRPIGIDLRGLLAWLTNDNVYDEDTQETRNLDDVNKAYYRVLTRYQIIFSVYGDREQLKGGKFDYQRNQIREIAQTKLDQLESLEEL